MMKRFFSSSNANVPRLQLNNKLLSCTSLSSLQSAILEGKDMDKVNISTSFSRLSKLSSPTSKPDTTVLYDLLSKSQFVHFPPRELSSIVYSIAKGKLLPQIPEVYLSKLKTSNLSLFNPQDFSNLLYGLARIDSFHDHLLLKRLSKHLLMVDLTKFKPQELANTTWSLAKLRHHNPYLIRSIAKEVGLNRNLAVFQPQELSNIVWSFASFRFYSYEVCEKVSREVVGRNLATFKPQELVNLLVAFAQQHFVDEAVIGKITEEIQTRGSWINSQDFVNTLYSLCSLDVLHLKQVQTLFQALPQVEVNRILSVAQQLFQIQLAWSQTQTCSSPVIDRAYCEEWIEHVLAADKLVSTKSSKAHGYIANLLTETLWDSREIVHEVRLLGGIDVDMYIPSRRAVVEVDGPHHFFVHDPTRPTGSTLFKRRLLERAGFHVFSIPLLQFEKAELVKLAEKLSQLPKSQVQETW
jgi:very-short-patch-repair endonuclease